MACNTKPGVKPFLDHLEAACGVKVTQQDWHDIREKVKATGVDTTRTRATQPEIAEAINRLVAATSDDPGTSDQTHDAINGLQQSLMGASVTRGTVAAVNYLADRDAARVVELVRRDRERQKEADAARARVQADGGCDCGDDCGMTQTDCCGEWRPNCETASDEEVTVCTPEFGCGPDHEQAAREAEDREYERWLREDLEAHVRDNEDQVPPAPEAPKAALVAEGKRLIWKSARPYGAPVMHVRGGATQVPEVKAALKDAGFRWDGQRHAWSKYAYDNEVMPTLDAMREEFGFDMEEKDSE